MNYSDDVGNSVAEPEPVVRSGSRLRLHLRKKTEEIRNDIEDGMLLKTNVKWLKGYFFLGAGAG